MTTQIIHPRPRPGRSIYRIQEITEVTGFTRAWIYKLMACGEFPKAHKIGIRAVGWDSTEVDAWISGKMGVGA